MSGVFVTCCIPPHHSSAYTNSPNRNSRIGDASSASVSHSRTPSSLTIPLALATASTVSRDGAGRGLTAYEGEAWIQDPSIHQDVKNYAGMVSMVDYNVGQVLDLLKELGLEENTIVFFTGDNGGQDRIRTQMSAAHSREELDRAIDAFIEVGRDMGLIQ